MVNEWTRSDFARIDLHPMSTPTTVLDAVAEWLNEHHPKPEDWRTDANLEARTMTAERDRDRWRRAHEFVERERDQARATVASLCERLAECSARAEAAERHAEQSLFSYDRAHRERDEAVARAEAAEARTAITREDVISALTVGIRGTTDGDLIDQDASIPSGECVRLAVDAACDLFGIEAGQATDPDPVDALADILYGDELVTDQMRGVLERVVRAGMLFPGLESDL